MKSIEIKTTQNVVLQYELADLRDRIIAFIIDIVCVLVTMWLLVIIFTSAFVLGETGGILLFIFVMSIFMFYSLAFESLNNGQSLGKMAMRIQVIKTAGGHATFSDYAARWVFRMVDIYFSFGGIATILVASSSKAQRIGDVVANTAVVKLTPRMDLKLKDLLSIHSKASYNPVYPQAKQLVEDDALLIKTTLDRYKRFDNDAHEEALQMMAQRICEILKIENTIGDNRKFLGTILNDYVVLTR